MSDFILKFWPVENVPEDKTAVLITELKARNILGDKTQFWGERAYKLSVSSVKYLTPMYSLDDAYVEKLAIFVKKDDYGIGIGGDDFEYFDRRNVITINGGDGELQRSAEFCKILQEITGDEYATEFELL